MTHDASAPDNERLLALWKQTEQEFSRSFLRQAISPENSFADLALALDYTAGHADLAHLSLGDILELVCDQTAPDLEAHGPADVTRLQPRTRTRRPVEATQAIKEFVEQRLNAVPNEGVSTTDLGDQLRKAGHSIDNAKLNILLNNMREAGRLTCTDGRPKVWRPRVQGRTSAEPMMIRKAAASTPSEAHEPTPAEVVPISAAAPETKGPSDPSRLMSQAEVQAAAAALRERLFKNA